MDGEDVFRKKICVEFAEKENGAVGGGDSCVSVDCSVVTKGPSTPLKLMNEKMSLDEQMHETTTLTPTLTPTRNRDAFKDRKSRNRRRADGKKKKATNTSDSQKTNGNKKNKEMSPNKSAVVNGQNATGKRKSQL